MLKVILAKHFVTKMVLLSYILNLSALQPQIRLREDNCNTKLHKSSNLSTDQESMTYALISEYLKNDIQNIFRCSNIFQLFLSKSDILYSKALPKSYLRSPRSEMFQQFRAKSFHSQNLLRAATSQNPNLCSGKAEPLIRVCKFIKK